MLGLGTSLSTATSVGSWNPSRLSNLIIWFRFNHGIELDGDGDVTKWTNQHTMSRTHGDVHVEQDGGATTSPILNADGSVEFDAASNFLRFKDGGSNTTIELGTFAIYFRIKWGESETLNAEDLVEKDSNNFFKVVSPTATRAKLQGTRHDWTHSEINEGDKTTIGFERNGEGVLSSYFNGVAGSPDSGEGTQTVDDTLDFIQFGKPTHHSYWYTVVVCNAALSVADRALLNSYLDTI